MKKHTLAVSAVAAAMAMTAVGSASAASDQAAEPTIGKGNAALAAHPTAGRNVNYRGTIVPAGGVEISQGKIAYDGGKTILTVPEADGTVTPMAYSDCASGYLCLWQDSNYNGRRLQFSSTGCHNLGNYGFNDEASSWRNRLNRYARLRWDSNCNGNYITASSGASSSSMGSWNDEVSSVGIS